MRRHPVLILSTVLFASTFASIALAQDTGRGRGGAPPRVTRPPLFLKEEWKQTPAGGEHPVDPAQALSNPNLDLKLYGPSSKDVLMTGSAQDENNPTHLWTG